VIGHVFTISREMLGEYEDWLYELSIDMLPEDACLHVYGVGDDEVTAFTLNQDRISDNNTAHERREQPDNRARVAGHLDDDLVIGLRLPGELQ